MLEGAPTVDELEARLAELGGPRRGARRVLARRARPPRRRARPRGLARGPARARASCSRRPCVPLPTTCARAGRSSSSATRLGGHHGYDVDGACEAMGGAVTGFTKALARERPEALVKVIDVEPSRKTAALADILMAETTGDPAAVEVGYADGHRWGVGLHDEPARRDPARTLAPDSVFVVTGAAGSIVAAIVADLATAAPGTFHLLDLVPEPEPGDPDLERLGTDRDGLKRDLAERIAARGQRATPALVERELSRLERSAAAAPGDRRGAGGRRCRVLAPGRPDRCRGRGRGDRRGARRSRSRRRARARRRSRGESPSARQVASRVRPGLRREGRRMVPPPARARRHRARRRGGVQLDRGSLRQRGQTDYSAANDLLCKSISGFRTTRPGTRGVAIDWTAWRDIGMASRGSIPTMMAAAGIDMLPPVEGVPVVRRELEAAGAGGEVLVAGALGVLVEERHATGGVDLDAAGDRTGPSGPMVGRVAGWSLADGLLATTRLDPTAHGFLRDHRIDGTPVLPGVMGIEAFAEVAALMVPDLVVAAIEAVDFLAPVKFYRDEPRVVELSARPRLDGDTLVVDCALVARRTLASWRGADDGALHRPRTCWRCEPAPRETAAVAHDPDQRRRRFRRDLRHLLPRSRLPRARRRVARRRARGRPPRPEPPGEPRTGRPADPHRAAPRRAVLPDRRGARARYDRVHGPAHPRRPGGIFSGRGRHRPVLGGRDPAPRRSEDRRRRHRRHRHGARPRGGLPEGRRCRFGPPTTRSRRCGRRWAEPVPRSFTRLAVVNRGECAMRLVHAVRELNYGRATSRSW